MYPVGGSDVFGAESLWHVDMDFRRDIRYGVGGRRSVHEENYEGTMWGSHSSRVEWLVTRWQEEKTQEEKKADHKLNERMDHWMKEITKEQREAIEDCIDDMLDGNGMCQLYLYEEGVKDGIRLMKMIRDMW